MLIVERRIKHNIIETNSYENNILRYYIKILEFERIFLEQVKMNKKLANRLIINLQKFDRNFENKYVKLSMLNEFKNDVESYINYFKNELNNIEKYDVEKLFIESEKEILINLNNKNFINTIYLINENLNQVFNDDLIKLNNYKSPKLSNKRTEYNIFQRIFYKVSPFGEFCESSIINNKLKSKSTNFEISLNFLYQILDIEVIKDFCNQNLCFNNSMIEKDNSLWITGFVSSVSNLYRTNQVTLKIFDTNQIKVLNYLNKKYLNKTFIVKTDEVLKSNKKFLIKLFDMGYIYIVKPKNQIEVWNTLQELTKNKLFEDCIVSLKNNNFSQLKESIIKIKNQYNNTTSTSKLIYINTVYEKHIKNDFIINNDFKVLFALFNDDVILKKYLSCSINDELLYNGTLKQKAKLFREISLEMYNYYNNINSKNLYGYSNEVQNPIIKNVIDIKNKIIFELINNDSLSHEWLAKWKNIIEKELDTSGSYAIFGNINKNKYVVNHIYAGGSKYKNRFTQYYEQSNILSDIFDIDLNFGFNANLRSNFKSISILNAENNFGIISWENIEIKKAQNTIKTFYNNKEIKIAFQGTLIATAVTPIVSTLSKLYDSGGLYFTFTELLFRMYYKKNMLTKINTFNRKIVDNVVLSRKTTLINDEYVLKILKKLSIQNLHQSWCLILYYFLKNNLPLRFYSIELRLTFREEYKMKMKKNLY